MLTLTARNGSSTKPAQGSGRKTRPWYFDPYAQSGFGYVPRRGLDDISRRFLSGEYGWDSELLQQFSSTYPLRLLALIAEVHPLVTMARSNNHAFGFAPGDTRIVALKQPEGASRDDG